jgi:6-pyruvoyltetrahydropterin/6-carboxytetrahydropterin synthase
MGYKVIVDGTELKFSACHFLREPLKCSRIHGHNYYVSVEVSSELDENHFVVDFIKLKHIVRSITESLDHYVLIPDLSQDLKVTKHHESVEILTENNKKYAFPISDVKFLPIKATTSEILAKYIHDKIKEIFPDKKIVVKLKESRSTTAIFES